MIKIKRRIDIKGSIVPNNYVWYYDVMRQNATCPKSVYDVLSTAARGDEIEVYINSPGGVISAGSEIYTMLREAAEKYDVKIYITGQACSAASVIACASYCEMSPTALMMVHCVSTGASGNHNALEHTAEVLRTADRALCTAYMAKAGMSETEALDMMERETWLTAQQAKERGLIDKIMFEQEKEQEPMTAAYMFRLPTEEQMARAKAVMTDQIGDATGGAEKNAKDRKLYEALILAERKNY